MHPASQVQNAPMRCRVTRLRDQGRRLKRSELQPPKEGDLSIFDRAPEPGQGRYTLQASLTGERVGQVYPNVLQPLFDVQVLKIDATGMYVQGREIHPEEGTQVVVETMQVWLCQPCAPSPTTAPKSESEPEEGRA